MTSTLSDNYITDSSFETAIGSGHGKVLVIIVANWSGSCHLMDPIFKKLGREFQKNITIFKMDYETNAKTVAAYGVGDLPTLLFFQNGRLVDQMVGTVSKSELSCRFQRFLERV